MSPRQREGERMRAWLRAGAPGRIVIDAEDMTWDEAWDMLERLEAAKDWLETRDRDG